MPKRRAATRQLPKLGESDNDARKAWRGGNRPNKAFRLPRGFDPFQKAAGTQVLQAIASKSQAHIQAKHIQGVKNAIELQIWGDTSQCAAALQEIQVWLSGEGLSESGSSSAPKKFDRVQAYFEDRQPEILKQLRIEERRQLFRQQRPANATLFDHVYMVKWKPSGWALEDVLGQSLEGLDPIRMDCLCYIDFLNTTTNIAGGPCFVISGNKEKKVKRAAERLKNIDKHILARRFEHFQFFLVKPIGVQSPIDYSRYEIQLSSYNELKKVTLRNNTPVIEREAGKTMHLGTKLTSDSIFLNEEEEAIWSIEDLQPGSVCLGAKHAQHHMEQYLDHYLMSTLKYLPYYSGFVEMRATLGTCVFTSYKTAPDEAYDLRTFEEMLGDRNTQENEMEAHFTSKLGDEKVEFELRDRFFAASELFAFKDAPYFGAPAEKCDPIYKAVFHIEGNANTPDYRLEVDYRQSGQDEFNEAPVRWYRLDPGEDDLTKMVEITLIDLNNSSTSFNLSVSACQILNATAEAKLPVTYTNFANSICLKPEIAKKEPGTPGSNNLFFDFSRVGGILPVPVRQIEQRRCWQFYVRAHPGYIVEVFSTQKCDYKKGTAPSPKEERYGVQIWHEQWDIRFNENKNLGIGERTTWLPAEWQFFSVDGQCWSEDSESTEFEVGSGYAELLRVMGAVEKLVQGKIEEKIRATRDKGKAKAVEPPAAPIERKSEPALDPEPSWGFGPLPPEPIRPSIKSLANGQSRATSSSNAKGKGAQNKKGVQGPLGQSSKPHKGSPAPPTSFKPLPLRQSSSNMKAGKPLGQNAQFTTPRKPQGQAAPSTSLKRPQVQQGTQSTRPARAPGGPPGPPGTFTVVNKKPPLPAKNKWNNVAYNKGGNGKSGGAPRSAGLARAENVEPAAPTRSWAAVATSTATPGKAKGGFPLLGEWEV